MHTKNSMLLQAPWYSYHAWIAYRSTCRVVVPTTDHATRGGISHVLQGHAQRMEHTPNA